jgi:hypothetical protein
MDLQLIGPFLTYYDKNLNKEGMHQAKSLKIVSPVPSFMMCYVSSLDILRK